MRRVLRCWLAPLAGCVLALGLSGPGRAADEAPAGHEKGGADQKLYELLRDVINEGADLYNAGDYAGCYHLWEGSLRTLAPFLEHHADWRKSIDGALAEARGVPVMWERAWVLRRAMDKIRDDIHPPKKAETVKPEPIEAAPRPAGGGAAPPTGGGEAPATRGPKSATGGEAPKATTLWDRLGGEKGVGKVIDDVVKVAGTDPRVDFSRGDKFQMSKDDLAKFRKEMIYWVSDKTGGPFKYTGESMKKAHKGMGITDAQFDAFVEDVKSVLKKDGVKGEDERAVVDALEATRKDIVEKKAEEEPAKKPEEKKPEQKKPEEKRGESKSGEKKPEEKKSGEGKKTEGEKPKATVTGHVTLEGKPVAGGDGHPDGQGRDSRLGRHRRGRHIRRGGGEAGRLRGDGEVVRRQEEGGPRAGEVRRPPDVRTDLRGQGGRECSRHRAEIAERFSSLVSVKTQGRRTPAALCLYGGVSGRPARSTWKPAPAAGSAAAG